MNNKVLTLLGFASKAGKLSYGQREIKNSICSSKAHLAVICGEISPKSHKEISFYALKKSVPIMFLNDISTAALSKAVGRSCKAVSVNDASFADALIKQRSTGGNANDK